MDETYGHETYDGHEAYLITLSHYIDPRILIGFCLRNFLDFTLSAFY